MHTLLRNHTAHNIIQCNTLPLSLSLSLSLSFSTGEDFCRNCCYSTPYVTLSSVGLTAIGLIGFALAGLYGVATMNTVTQLQDG